jgi:hypothetical protein
MDFAPLKTCFHSKGYLIEVAVKSLCALRRLYELQTFALPRFVLGASPFVAPGDEPLLNALRHVTIQQEHMASQLYHAILLLGGLLPKGNFPASYSSLHDLELRYLLTAVCGVQGEVVRWVDEQVHALRDDAPALRLALEFRRNETAHLHLFEELCLRYAIDGRPQPGNGQPLRESEIENRKSKCIKLAA